MSSLTAIFGQPAEKSPAEDEKLMDLYWNRNELKKEFGSLRNEKYELADRLKVQKGDIARLEQKIGHLEELLLNPEWSRSIMVHYQLRALDLQCMSKVARFAEQLKQQREQKKHGKAIAAWRESMAADVVRVEDEIRSIRTAILQVQEQLQQLHQRFTSMNRLVRFFKRRSINRELSSATTEIKELEHQALQRNETIQNIQDREPPETVGLTLAEKRSINHMIIAYAQELYTQFRDDEMVGIAKEAAEKSAGAVRYGSDSDCEDIIARLRSCERRLLSAGDCTEALKKRTKLLADGAQYQHNDHAVPLSPTVATLYRFDQNGIVRTSDLDLLGRNYWKISSAMSR